MKQQDFEKHHGEFWKQFQNKLKEHKATNKLKSLPEEYESISHHLAMAKQRRYSKALIRQLNDLVVMGHERMYGELPRYKAKFLYYLLIGFPQALRQNSGFVWTATFLFFGPLFLFFLLCLFNEDVIYTIMSADQVKQFEAMYDHSAESFGRERKSDTDLMMFFFYIKNNIGISFQTFSSGVVFGLGSIFFLVYNGLYIGAVSGHAAKVGLNDTFFPFVIGHGAFELTAIAFAGAAGLKLGWSLIAPGESSRLHSLKLASKDAIVIIYGTTMMLLIAAFLEAFWSSSSSMEPSVKYIVGTVFWVFVLVYIFFAGRGTHGSKSV